MDIQFFGAAQCITGSCHLVTFDHRKILLDCGLFQGKDSFTYKNDDLGFNPSEVDYVILSHCHIDHSGKIPFLIKCGFKGKIICTEPTVDLCRYILMDAAQIFQEEDEIPLYSGEDVIRTMEHFQGFNYNEEISLWDDISVILKDAGHVLGSAICEILIKKNNKSIYKMVYSGDIGNVDKDILKDPQTESGADILIIESTYGNKIHKVWNNYPKLLNIAKKTIARGGNLVIPCFSLGSTQEIIYMLNRYVENGLLEGCHVYVDSPLASAVTEIFTKYQDYFDSAAKDLIRRGDDPLDFKDLHFVRNDDDITTVNSGAIIIVAGGVHQGSRINRQLMRHVGGRKNSILLTSYGGNRSVGRRLIKGYRQVEIMGRKMEVRASIFYMGGLSLHADSLGLMNWVEKMVKKPDEVILVHGEGKNIETFRQRLLNKNYHVKIAEFKKKIRF